jgi:hypothetical protein
LIGSEASSEVAAVPSSISEYRDDVFIVLKFLEGIKGRIDAWVIDCV